MAKSRSNTGPRGSVGLDLDGDFLAAVSVADGRIQSAVSTELPEGVMHDGEVVDPEALGHVLKEIFRAGALPRDVRLGVANQQIVVRQLELPRIEEDKDLEAAVRFQAAEAIAMPLNEVVLDYHRVGDGVDAEGNPRTNVVVVAARESMIERLVEAVRSAGLRPVGIDLNAFALVRALVIRRARRLRARVLPPRRRSRTSPSRSARAACSPARSPPAPDESGVIDALRARRGDPPLDRLLPRAAGDPAGARDRAVGAARSASTDWPSSSRPRPASRS